LIDTIYCYQIGHKLTSKVRSIFELNLSQLKSLLWRQDQILYSFEGLIYLIAKLFDGIGMFLEVHRISYDIIATDWSNLTLYSSKSSFFFKTNTST